MGLFLPDFRYASVLMNEISQVQLVAPIARGMNELPHLF